MNTKALLSDLKSLLRSLEGPRKILERRAGDSSYEYDPECARLLGELRALSTNAHQALQAAEELHKKSLPKSEKSIYFLERRWMLVRAETETQTALYKHSDIPGYAVSVLTYSNIPGDRNTCRVCLVGIEGPLRDFDRAPTSDIQATDADIARALAALEKVCLRHLREKVATLRSYKKQHEDDARVWEGRANNLEGLLKKITPTHGTIVLSITKADDENGRGQ